jgi:hypothetical protein
VTERGFGGFVVRPIQRLPAEIPVSQRVFTFSTPALADHRRDVQIIARQHLARASSHHLHAPDDEALSRVVNTLTLWVHRLQLNPGSAADRRGSI